MIVQGFAAIQSLPAAPTATDSTGDNIANLVTYQSALIAHAERVVAVAPAYFASAPFVSVGNPIAVPDLRSLPNLLPSG